MTARQRVIGVGQSSAGDDGAGLAVLAELERRTLPAGTELMRLGDPMDLVLLLDGAERLVLVDAVLGSPPGRVLELAPADLARSAQLPASSHGFGAADALELACVLSPEAVRRLCIVAITIERPDRQHVGLSPDVAAAIPRAADHVLAQLGASSHA